MIYLNNAATSWPKPPCVAEAVSNAIAKRPGAAHRGGIDDFDVFQAVRDGVSRLLKVSDPSRIALGPNASWGLNLAIFGFPFVPGDTVVTTRAEHNSVLRPLWRLESEGRIKTVYLDTDGFGRVDPELWNKAMQKYRPKLAVFTHASNVTGAVNDAPALIEAAHAVNASVLVDVSQTLGYLDFRSTLTDADMIAFTGHKYLLGPQGTGGLYVRCGLTLSPHLVGGTGIKSDMDTMPEEMPLHLEAGTGNEPGFHGLLAALDWAKQNPLDEDGCLKRLTRLREGLSRAGANVISPEGDTTPVVSFTVPSMACSELGFMLNESCGVCCRTGLHCAPKIFSCLGVPETVRFSLSRFTTDDDIDFALRSLEDCLG